MIITEDFRGCLYGIPLSLYKEKIMSTRRQRQILRNRKLEFQRRVEENLKKAPKEEPKEEKETKIVKKTKKTKKEDK
jgi:hypothetical protein